MLSSLPRSRCVGSSLAATAAEVDCVEVDDGVEWLLSSAPPPPPRQKIRGQTRAAEALNFGSLSAGGLSTGGSLSAEGLSAGSSLSAGGILSAGSSLSAGG